MKKLIFYYVANANDDPQELFLGVTKNSRLSFNGADFYLNSKYASAPEKIAVAAQAVEFNEQLSDFLCMVARDAKAQAASIGAGEEVGFEREPGSICSLIASIVQKSYYETPASIFLFAADLFAAILMGHKLTNGNKRTATLFLAFCLRSFGYHLKWSKGALQDWTAHKTVIETFVTLLENSEHVQSADSFKIKVTQIADWIRANSVIALEWR